MKWYKKQIDKLQTSKPEPIKSVRSVIMANPQGHSFGLKKMRIINRAYPSPVAASKLSRSKTNKY